MVEDSEDKIIQETLESTEKLPEVRIALNAEEQKISDEMKPYFKTKTRAKVFRKCLKATYDNLKNLGALK